MWWISWLLLGMMIGLLIGTIIEHNNTRCPNNKHYKDDRS